MAFQMIRKKTRRVEIGGRAVGGGEPILIQSMTNTRTEDVKATIGQIQRLTAAGCEIIRCAVPNMEAAEALAEIKKGITIPLVADIHFDYRLAVEAIRHGEYRGQGADPGGHRRGKRAWDPDPRGREQRLFGEGAGGKISGGDG